LNGGVMQCQPHQVGVQVDEVSMHAASVAEKFPQAEVDGKGS